MIFGEGPIIKNIAGDLNKLFLQGTRTGQPINNVEGSAAADQGTVALMADRDPVIRDISTGLGYAGREVTVSGTGALQLVNSLGQPLKSWSVELTPYQEGSGDPSPENVRRIYGTNKLKLFVEESYDPSATPKVIINVPALSANQWDEEWEVGTINNTTGEPSPDTNNIRSKNYIPVIPNESYYFYKSTSIGNIRYYWYDIDYGFISGNVVSNEARTAPSNAYFLKIRTTGTYGTTFNHDFCVNYPSTVTTYNPYSNTIYNGQFGIDGGESRWAKKRITAFTGAWGATANGFAVYASAWDGIRTGVQMCDKFAFSSSGYADMPVYSWYGGSGASTSFTFILPSTITSLSEANQWIADNGGYIEFTYQLATPIQFTITTPDIPTPRGDAVAWVTAEDGIVTNFSATYLQGE